MTTLTELELNELNNILRKRDGSKITVMTQGGYLELRREYKNTTSELLCYKPENEARAFIRGALYYHEFLSNESQTKITEQA